MGMALARIGWLGLLRIDMEPMYFSGMLGVGWVVCGGAPSKR